MKRIVLGVLALGLLVADGVVTYCLDKRRQSPEFPLVRKLFHEFTDSGPQRTSELNGIGHARSFLLPAEITLS